MSWCQGQVVLVQLQDHNRERGLVGVANKPYPQGEGPEERRGLYQRRACGECGETKASMACYDMLNDAQGCRVATSIAALDRIGECKSLRDALRGARHRAAGRRGCDPAARRAWEAADEALTAHDAAVRELVASVQSAATARASRNCAAAQSLAALSIQSGHGLAGLRQWIEMAEEREQTFVRALDAAEVKMAAADRAAQALQQAWRDVEAAAAARPSIYSSVRVQAEAGAGSGGADSVGSAVVAQGVVRQVPRARGRRARVSRVARASLGASVLGCRAAGPQMQAAGGLGSQVGGIGEQLRTPAAWVRPSRALGARGRCGGACAPSPYGPRLFGQPPGRPPGG